MVPGNSADAVIVGGGIAGSALALVLARGGYGVTVLERQTVYADHVRGEYMQPWGVAEALRLGILDVLQDAGGIYAPRSVGYDEMVPPHIAETVAQNNGGLLPGVAGSMCIGHPAMCQALSNAAEKAGARYFRGVGQVQVTIGSKPSVSFESGGVPTRVECRLIVGADGRTSAVRGQAGLTLQRAEPTHLIAGLLVDGVPDWPRDTYSIGTEGDVQYLVFPQGERHARLYTCTALDQRERYAGPGGASRFLADFRQLTCLPRATMIANATPAGPCATLGAEDTWLDRPLAEGLVLIGDAAGYNDPITGQGLSLSLRDVRVVSGLLLADRDWSTERLTPYADERRERMRRVRYSAALVAALFTTFGPEGAARRRRAFARFGDPTSRAGAGLMGLGAGPEVTPDWATTEEFRAEFLQ